MDMAKMLESLEKNSIKVHLIMQDKKVLEVRAKGKSIDVEILDFEGVKSFLKEARSWKA